MLSEEKIQYGKDNVNYSLKEGGHHEHDDCIRMAYEWLDAQRKTKRPTTKTYPIKHIIETWAGRYVSRTDVEVAAFLHPEIQGTYPHFNIDSRLTRPSDSRLNDLVEAFAQTYREDFDPSIYSAHEQPDD